MRYRFALMATVLASVAGAMAAPIRAERPWPRQSVSTETLERRFVPPAGFVRVPVTAGSLGAWLRQLPLMPADAPVMLHDGRVKPRQDVHAAVIDIDIGTRDLQQCADAIMRLRAEYLWSVGRAHDVVTCPRQTPPV
jgi:hypothetical protein